MSTGIESFCRQLSDGLSITTSPKGGFVGPQTRFMANIGDENGVQTGSLPLRVEWLSMGEESLSRRVSSATDGSLSLSYPAEESFHNTGVRLRVSTDFARWAASPGPEVLARIDSASVVKATFRHFDDVDAFFSREVLVPGGPFTAGAVPQDIRSTGGETPREARTPEFFIDLSPVTNALFRMYLEDTGAEIFPEYWGNPRFNHPDQPVVGVSYEEARGFASWLSGQLGVVKRLPTEDEWEKAARGGREVIFPWGDESPNGGPSEGARANYNGEGRFDATSPVGSYEDGRNAYGIYDMAGNVWELTSTRRDNGSLIVKGGSWMDGPADLRISNRREIDPSKGYADVGFRLIREVSDE
jgi:hypothetical protein